MVTSPENYRYRARVRALHLQGLSIPAFKGSQIHRSLPSAKTYLGFSNRWKLTQGCRWLYAVEENMQTLPVVLHVNFSGKEISYMAQLLRSMVGGSFSKDAPDTEETIFKLLKRSKIRFSKIATKIDIDRLDGRSENDIYEYLQDVLEGKTEQNHEVLYIDEDALDAHGRVLRAARIPALLRARETYGQQVLHSGRRYTNFKNEVRKALADDLALQVEFTGCAGDISTITWASTDAFICGTTTHMDSRNQQYNKSGNLVLGSAKHGTLKAYADHRVVRPLVRGGENATEAIRQSQDPWLYSSVVSSDYDPTNDRAYTSGFDKTARVWRVDHGGTDMALLGTWEHEGNVNFVKVSKHHAGRVATAADVPVDAIRIYDVDEHNVSGSRYRTYSSTRLFDADGNPVLTDKWSYFPATINWGLAEKARRLLLVGYSPRSLTEDDNDIPEDRLNTGQLCLWDGLTGEQWKIIGGTLSNVFEVLWHPTQECFFVSASPKILGLEDGTRTQIRIFRPSENKGFAGKAYIEIQLLDCPAADINEIAVMWVPTSPQCTP